MVLRMIIMILTTLGVLIGSHYFLYYSAIQGFGIDKGVFRQVLLGSLLFLSVTFPITAPIVRFWRNFFSQLCFYLAMAWVALLVNLLLATIAGWALAGVMKLVGRGFNPKWIAIIVVVASVLFTVYGVLRARYPQVHRINVRIEGLPESWQGRTIVQLSDIHLGNIIRAGFMEQIARKVNAIEPDVVVITGDLFDGLGGEFASFLKAIDLLEAKHGVFFVIGNHEIYNNAASLLQKTKLRELNNEVVDLDGLQIAGVKFPGLRNQKELAQLRRKLSKDKPSILLFHTPTSVLQAEEDAVSQQMTTYWMPDTSCALNRELGIDLQLSGHTHAGQIFPFGFISSLIYKGRDRGLHKDGTFNLYVSSGTGTFGPPMRTAGRSEIVAITLK